MCVPIHVYTITSPFMSFTASNLELYSFSFFGLFNVLFSHSIFYVAAPPRLEFTSCSALCDTSPLRQGILPSAHSKEPSIEHSNVLRTTCHRNRYSEFEEHFGCPLAIWKARLFGRLWSSRSNSPGFTSYHILALPHFRLQLNYLFVACSEMHLPFTTLSPQDNVFLNIRMTASKLTYGTRCSDTGFPPHDLWLHVWTSVSHKPGV